MSPVAPAAPAPPKWKAYKLSAQALGFYSAYAPKIPAAPHPAELDRFSAPDGWEFSPERMDQDSASGRNPMWRSTQSENIHRCRNYDVGLGYQQYDGYGVRWQQLAGGESSPVPQGMLTQWLDETRGAPRTGEDIRQLLEQSRSSTLPTPSLECLVTLRRGNPPYASINMTETPMDGVRGNDIADEGSFEYAGYDLIPESEVTNVHNLLEDYYRPRTS